MIDIGNLGKEIFFIDPKQKKVKEGRVSGIQITQTGYVIISIFCTEGTPQLENKHVFLTKDSAEQRLIEIKPLLAEADKEIEETTERVNKLRVEVIGEPEFLEFAKQITGSK